MKETRLQKFFKLFSIFVFIFLLGISGFKTTYAADIIDDGGSTAASLDEPTLGSMKDMLIRVLNWLVFLVGIVFVFVIAYGAWKAATALGDPRGLESAKATWTYALYGVIIVLGFFSLFSIIGGFFGFQFGLSELFDELFSGIDGLVKAGITDPVSQSGN